MTDAEHEVRNLAAVTFNAGIEAFLYLMQANLVYLKFKLSWLRSADEQNRVDVVSISAIEWAHPY